MQGWRLGCWKQTLQTTSDKASILHHRRTADRGTLWRCELVRSVTHRMADYTPSTTFSNIAHSASRCSQSSSEYALRKSDSSWFYHRYSPTSWIDCHCFLYSSVLDVRLVGISCRCQYCRVCKTKPFLCVPFSSLWHWVLYYSLCSGRRSCLYPCRLRVRVGICGVSSKFPHPIWVCFVHLSISLSTRSSSTSVLTPCTSRPFACN